MTGSLVFVPVSVLLELECVLRALYEFGASDFASVVDRLLGLPSVVIEARANVIEALGAHRAGLGFADAPHLFSGRHCSALTTFDDPHFARKARPIGLRPAVTVAA